MKDLCQRHLDALKRCIEDNKAQEAAHAGIAFNSAMAFMTPRERVSFILDNRHHPLLNLFKESLFTVAQVISDCQQDLQALLTLFAQNNRIATSIPPLQLAKLICQHYTALSVCCRREGEKIGTFIEKTFLFGQPLSTWINKNPEIYPVFAVQPGLRHAANIVDHGLSTKSYRVKVRRPVRIGMHAIPEGSATADAVSLRQTPTRTHTPR